jgi:hypothetical protein
MHVSRTICLASGAQICSNYEAEFILYAFRHHPGGSLLVIIGLIHLSRLWAEGI